MRASSLSDHGCIKVDLSSFWSILEFPNYRSQTPPASIFGHSLALPRQDGQQSKGKIHTLTLPPAITPNSHTETEDHSGLMHTGDATNEIQLPPISPSSATANGPSNNGTRDSLFFDGIDISVEDFFSQDFINTDILDVNWHI
jgi:hypothetical protein